MATAPKAPPREFVASRDDKSTIKLTVRKPTRKEIEYADLEYSAKFNLAICNGIPTHTKLLANLRANDVIDKATETKLGQLATDHRALEKQIARDQFPKPEDKAEAQKKLEEIAKQAQDLNAEVDSFFEHTAESKASKAQRNFLLACVTAYADGDNAGKRVWATVEELLNEEDGSLLNRAYYEYVACQRDIPSEWEKLMAEQEAEAKQEEAKTDAAPDASATPPAAPEAAPDASQASA